MWLTKSKASRYEKASLNATPPAPDVKPIQDEDITTYLPGSEGMYNNLELSSRHGSASEFFWFIRRRSGVCIEVYMPASYSPVTQAKIFGPSSAGLFRRISITLGGTTIVCANVVEALPAPLSVDNDIPPVRTYDNTDRSLRSTDEER